MMLCRDAPLHVVVFELHKPMNVLCLLPTHPVISPIYVGLEDILLIGGPKVKQLHHKWRA